MTPPSWFAEVFAAWRPGFELRPAVGTDDYQRLGGFTTGPDETRSRCFAWGTASIIVYPTGGVDDGPRVECYARDKFGSLRCFATAGSRRQAIRLSRRLARLRRFREPRHWAKERRDEARAAMQQRRIAHFFTKRGAAWRELARLGVSTVQIDFSGSGDSGGIDGIDAQDATGKRVPLPTKLREEIEEAFYERFPYSFDNDGCYGSVELDVRLRKAEGSVQLPTTYTEHITLSEPPKAVS